MSDAANIAAGFKATIEGLGLSPEPTVEVRKDVRLVREGDSFPLVIIAVRRTRSEPFTADDDTATAVTYSVAVGITQRTPGAVLDDDAVGTWRERVRKAVLQLDDGTAGAWFDGVSEAAGESFDIPLLASGYAHAVQWFEVRAAESRS